MDLNSEIQKDKQNRMMYDLKSLNVTSYRDEIQKNHEYLKTNFKFWDPNINNWDCAIIASFDKFCKKKKIVGNLSGNP